MSRIHKGKCRICNSPIAVDYAFKECRRCRDKMKYSDLYGVHIPPKSFDEKLEFIRLYNMKHNTNYTYGDYATDILTNGNKFK